MIVGVTGGIGSGKTAVSDRFAALGITVVDADLASRVVVEPGRPALNEIAAHFGGDILTADGELDRPALRSRIFSDPEGKQWLEQLLHPLIGEEILNQLQASESAYTVLVSPLLLEIGQAELCDRVLVVDVSRDTQLARTMARDDNSREQVERIIDSQMSRENRLARAHDVVPNEGSLQELHAAVDALHQHYLTMASHE